MTGTRLGGCQTLSDVSPWSQCALTDHLLITRDWGLLSPAPARGAHWTRSGLAAALGPRVPVLVLRSSRHNKLDFSSFRGEKRRAWALVSHPSVTPTSRRQTETVLTSGDIWNHLSSVGLFRNDGWMGGYCQTFQQCRRQSINLLNQGRDRSSVKSCLHFEQRASIPTPT